MIRSHVTQYGKVPSPYYWPLLTQNPHITWDIIISNQDLPWSYPHFILNRNLTFYTILTNSHINWKNYETVSSNYITWDQVIGNLNIICDPKDDRVWKLLSRRKDLDIHYVLKNRDKPWDWETISRHDSITGDIMEANPKIPWGTISVISKGRSWGFVKPYVKKELDRLKHVLSNYDYEEILCELYYVVIGNTAITWDDIRSDQFIFSHLQLYHKLSKPEDTSYSVL